MEDKFETLNDLYADVRGMIDLLKKDGFSEGADGLDSALSGSTGTEILLDLRGEAKKLQGLDNLPSEIQSRLGVYIKFIENNVTGIEFSK